jgi:hypothetical protein
LLGRFLTVLGGPVPRKGLLGWFAGRGKPAGPLSAGEVARLLAAGLVVPPEDR